MVWEVMDVWDTMLKDLRGSSRGRWCYYKRMGAL